MLISLYVNGSDIWLAAGSYNTTRSRADPITGVSYAWWYDTTNNRIGRSKDSGATWTYGYSFPFCRVIVKNGVLTVQHVYNSIGYIGTKCWIGKGVKYVVPNGRNTDGSLKNTIRITNEIKASGNITQNNGIIVINSSNVCHSTDSEEFYYDAITNYCYWRNQVAYDCLIGVSSFNNSVVQTWKINEVSQILDYNDTGYISKQSMPGDSYINLTLGASGASYRAPCDGYFSVCKVSSAANQYIEIITDITLLNISYHANNTDCYGRLFIPCKKGDLIFLQYNFGGDTREFRFIPSVGESH